MMPSLTIDALSRNARNLILLGGFCGLALIFVGWLDARNAAYALLTAWLTWLGLAAGSVVLLLTHALTGGRWGEIIRPVLAPAARHIFVLAIPFVIVALALHLIYPWAANPNSVTSENVARLYLNPGAFIIRGVAILALWAALGFAVARRTPLLPLWAGIGLGFYLLTVTVSAVDWSASLLPQWPSSAYGMLIGVSQATTAMAFALLLRSGEPSDPATSDLSGLLLAGILGLAYLGFMQFLVIWSSGVPDKTMWYDTRLEPGALALIAGAFLFGVVLPFLLLLPSSARRDARTAGLAGGLVLFGLALNWAWQIAPGSAMHALWFYPLAFVAVGGIWLGLSFGVFRRERLPQSGASRHA